MAMSKLESVDIRKLIEDSINSRNSSTLIHFIESYRLFLIELEKTSLAELVQVKNKFGAPVSINDEECQRLILAFGCFNLEEELIKADRNISFLLEIKNLKNRLQAALSYFALNYKEEDNRVSFYIDVSEDKLRGLTAGSSTSIDKLLVYNLRELSDLFMSLIRRIILKARAQLEADDMILNQLIQIIQHDAIFYNKAEEKKFNNYRLSAYLTRSLVHGSYSTVSSQRYCNANIGILKWQDNAFFVQGLLSYNSERKIFVNNYLQQSIVLDDNTFLVKAKIKTNDISSDQDWFPLADFSFEGLTSDLVLRPDNSDQIRFLISSLLVNNTLYIEIPYSILNDKRKTSLFINNLLWLAYHLGLSDSIEYRLRFEERELKNIGLDCMVILNKALRQSAALNMSDEERADLEMIKAAYIQLESIYKDLDRKFVIEQIVKLVNNKTLFKDFKKLI